MNPATEARTLARMRRILALIAVGTAAGGLVEMALLRHWGEATQIIPWVVLIAVLVVGLLVATGGGSRIGAQVTGAAGLLTGAIGIFLHLSENLDEGEDLAQYAQTWESMPFLERVWLALNGTVGEAPLLAPGMVSLAGVILFIAVLGRD